MVFDPLSKKKLKKNVQELPWAPRTAKLVLPMPISNNILHTPTPDGRIVLSKEAREYYEDMSYIVDRLAIEKFTGRLKITLNVYEPDKRRRDINNLTKSLFDALERCRVYDNDHQIDETHIFRRECKEGGEIHVEIVEIAELDVRKTIKEIKKETVVIAKEEVRNEILKSIFQKDRFVRNTRKS